MKTNSEILKHKLDEIRDILVELEFLKKDILSIHNTEEEYFEKMIKKSKFFYRLYLNYTKPFVIDCHKLIGQKEHYNILNLINFSQSNIRTIGWHHSIDISLIEKLKDKYYKTEEHFNTITLLRNKVYAHNDRNKSELKFSITLKDFWTVLSSLQEIFGEIHFHFDNTDWRFDKLYQKPVEIKQAYKFLKIRNLYYDSFISDTVEFSIAEIKNIIRN